VSDTTTTTTEPEGSGTLLDKIKAAYESVKAKLGRELGYADIPALLEEVANPTTAETEVDPIEAAISGAIKDVQGRLGRVFDDGIVGEIVKAAAAAVKALSA